MHVLATLPITNPNAPFMPPLYLRLDKYDLGGGDDDFDY